MVTGEGGTTGRWAMMLALSSMIHSIISLLELHRFGNGGGEINVILVGPLFAGDELNFSWIPHGVFVFRD